MLKFNGDEPWINSTSVRLICGQSMLLVKSNVMDYKYKYYCEVWCQSIDTIFVRTYMVSDFILALCNSSNYIVVLWYDRHIVNIIVQKDRHVNQMLVQKYVIWMCRCIDTIDNTHTDHIDNLWFHVTSVNLRYKRFFLQVFDFTYCRCILLLVYPMFTYVGGTMYVVWIHLRNIQFGAATRHDVES